MAQRWIWRDTGQEPKVNENQQIAVPKSSGNPKKDNQQIAVLKRQPTKWEEIFANHIWYRVNIQNI